MLVQILVLVILILINGAFSSSELAFLSIDKIKLKQRIKNGDKKAIKIKELIDNPSSFLATIQIAITFAGFLASAFAAEAFADEIVTYVSFIPISVSVLKTIIVVIVTLILSYFTLVFGELVPKRIALAYPDKVANAMYGIIRVLMKITYPFVWLLTKSTNVVSKLFKIKEKQDSKITEEEIKAIIANGKDEGAIEPLEKDLIFNIFSFNDTSAKQIMTKKESIVAVDISIGVKDLTNVIRRAKYTRIPVYDNSIDNIIGILNVKDMIIKYSKDYIFNLKDMLHESFFAYEDDKVDDIFRAMQKDRQSMAIIKNEEEKTVGIVTIEDAVEEIVGNIFDEYDEN